MKSGDIFKHPFYGQHHRISRRHDEAICGRPVPEGAVLQMSDVSGVCGRCKSGPDYHSVSQPEHGYVGSVEWLDHLAKSTQARLPTTPQERMAALQLEAKASWAARELNAEILL